MPSVKIKDILYSYNNRNPKGIKDLADSIKSAGLLQPLIVRLEKDKIFLVAGHRRLEAVKLLNWEEVEVKNVGDISEFEARKINLTENIARLSTNKYEEAQALKYFRDRGYSSYEVAKELSQNSSWADARYKILDLPEEVQEVVANFSDKNIAELHEIRFEKDKLFEMVALIRDANARFGRGSISLSRTKRKANQLVRRTPNEMTEMNILLYSMFGDHFVSKILPWAAGFVSDEALVKKIQEVRPDFELPTTWYDK